MYYLLVILAALLVIGAAALLVRHQNQRKQTIEELIKELNQTYQEILIDTETLTGIKMNVDFSLDIEELKKGIEEARAQLQTLKQQLDESPKERDLERRKNKRNVKPKKNYRNV